MLDKSAPLLKVAIITDPTPNKTSKQVPYSSATHYQNKRCYLSLSGIKVAIPYARFGASPVARFGVSAEAALFKVWAAMFQTFT